MTVVSLDPHSIDMASAVLRRGEPICIPMPSPLPYAVGARTARAVNEAKGRPGDQPAGMAIGNIDVVAPFVDLDDATLSYAEWLSAVRLLSIMLPVSGTVPEWAAGSASRGFVAVTLAWLPELKSLLDPTGHLFVSSGNTTGGSATVAAPAAAAQVGGRGRVLNGDAPRGRATPARSASIVRIQRGLKVEVVRPGIQHAARGVPPDRVLRSLLAEWRGR